MLHPIVSGLSPSPEQEPAILERGRDVVVTAGAGTGKTRTLVARYLALLSEGLPLRRIVAITFTQKAAREMRNRVREAVRTYIGDPALPEAERDRWQTRYSQLDAARISTIHSLCADILRAHPAEAGLDPRFEVLEEGSAALLRSQAIDEALARAADQPELVPLFGLLGEGALQETLADLLKRRLEAEVLFETLPTDLLSRWAEMLRMQQEQILTALMSSEAWQTCVADLRTNIANDPADKLEIQRQRTLTAIEAQTETLADQLAALAELSRIDLRGGAGGKWPGGKEQVADVKETLKQLRALWKEQEALLTLTLTDHDRELAEAIPTLGQLFTLVLGRYKDLKSSQNTLDFDDLEGGALRLLQERADVCQAWQETVRAILTDEFQDTNARQRDLLALLGGAAGKLFIVGDAKQSIYRFRGTDVAVFRQERQAIEDRGGAHFALSTSYRAHEALLTGMNALLQPVLGTAPDPDRPWAEPFTPLKPHRYQSGSGFEAPHIELQLAVGSKSDGALGRAANVLVQRLVELVESGDQQVGVGANARSLTYGHIAILCRASSSFAAYENALERAGVPFLTVAGRGFYGRPEIRDLLNVLQALADPDDDLALAGLLRSPSLALSDSGLYQLHLARDDGPTSLWQTLQAGQAQLSAEDQTRAQRAVDLIRSLHSQVGRTPIADLLKTFLDATAYRAALIRAGQPRAARNVSKLLADAHSSGIVGAGEFLAYIGGLRDVGAREGEARSPAEGVVQLMTVHAAKGLEFPVIVLGDATYQSPNRNEVLLDPQLGLLLPHKDADGLLPAAYYLGKVRADDQEAAEADRLLYVAATRAEEKLLLNGYVSLNRGGSLGRLNGWLGQLAGPEALGLAEVQLQYDEADPAPIRLQLQVGQTPVACTFYSPAAVETARSRYAPEVEPAWPTPLPPDLLEPLTAPLETVQPAEPRRVWRIVPAAERPRAPAWVVGHLVHAALALWRFPDETYAAWAEAQARNLGLTDPRQISNAAAESHRLLERFQAHTLYQTITQAEQRLHEVPYSLALDGQMDSGLIDLLYQQDGLWTLVEFKTDRVRDEAHRAAILRQTNYLAQVDRYRRAVQQLLGQEPEVILCWLNFGGRIEVQADLIRAGVE